jgi:hypothetical protein
MTQFEEVFDTLNSLKEELRRLRRIEQEYLKLKQMYEEMFTARDKDLEKDVKEPLPGFFFYSEEEKYTGYSAHSMKEFSEAIRNVSLQSIEFHFERKDFENWFNYIGQKGLAQQFEALRESMKTGNELRQVMINLLDQVIE